MMVCLCVELCVQSLWYCEAVRVCVWHFAHVVLCF